MPISNHDLLMIANYELAAAASRHVEGMRSFLSFFLKELPKQDLILIQRYQKIKDAVIDRTVSAHEKE